MADFERTKQEEQRKKTRRIYSTAVIDELIKERQQGYEIPYDAFFNRDLELRAPGITYRMTDEEMEIYQKCYDSPEFFIDNYCKFLTDKGKSLVKIRDYQRNVIKLVTDEKYIPTIDDWGPKHRNIIWMASRQSGKCNFYLSNIELFRDKKYKKISIGKLFNNKKFSFFKCLKCLLYKIYKSI